VPNPFSETDRLARKAAFERPANALHERGENYLHTVIFPEVDAGNARLAAVDPFALEPAALAAHLEEAFRWYERSWTLHWLWAPDNPKDRFVKLYKEITGGSQVDGGDGGTEGAGQADSADDEAARTAAGELLTHEPNLLTDAVDGLIELARIAQRHPPVRDILLTRPAADALSSVNEAAASDAIEGTAAFRTALDALLERQGLRCGAGFGSESDEMLPSWREDPSVVIALVQRYVPQDLDALLAARHAATAERDRRVGQIRAGIADPERLRQFDFWLDAARRAQQTFEDHNYKIDSAATSLLHLAITACGRRLAAAGRLDAAADVWWLHRHEIGVALSGLEAPADGPPDAKLPDWRQLVTARRALQAWHESLTPPETLGAPPPPKPDEQPGAGQTPKPTAEQAAPPEGVLATGQTGSAGKATGRVRLVDRNALVPDVQAGDVLVAHNAGPVWTPVFPTVAAVVLDEGVLFQHAMLTCREYGVPAIFRAKDATKRLQEGQRVTVDATHGWVLPADP
jgi:pyruvate,water dikinase